MAPTKPVHRSAMMKSVATLLMFCLSAVGPLAYAQSTVAEPPILEQAEKELVEVFSERAVDFESKNQVQAINVLRSLNVSDARFNQPTLKAMGDFACGWKFGGRLRPLNFLWPVRCPRIL